MRPIEAVEGMLKCPQGELDSRSRFLLVSVLAAFGWGSVSCTVNQLAKRLGVSAGLLTKAREALLSRQLIIAERVPAMPGNHGIDLAGRPRKGFRVNRAAVESLLAQIERPGKAVEAGQEKVGGLFDRLEMLFSERDVPVDAGVSVTRPQRGRPRGLNSRLLSDNKLMLGVLLANANDLGIVSGLGASELGRLTGMSDAQVRAQLRKLELLGHIASRVPGVACKSFFGVGRALIFLNLEHGRWEGLTRQVPQLVACGRCKPHESSDVVELFELTESLRETEKTWQQASDDVAVERIALIYSKQLGKLLQILDRVYPHTESTMVFGDIRRKRATAQDVDGQIREMWGGMVRLDRLLVDRPRSRQIDYLAARLAIYATRILNIEPNVPGTKAAKSVAYDSLLGSIEEEAIGKALNRQLSDSQQTWLAKLLYGLSWSVATQACIQVARAHKVKPADFRASGRYLILAKGRPLHYSFLYLPSTDTGGMTHPPSNVI